MQSLIFGTAYEDLEGKPDKSFCIDFQKAQKLSKPTSVVETKKKQRHSHGFGLYLKDLLRLTEQIFISLDFCSTFYQEKVESHGLAKTGETRAQ
ncbi:hypothetical protein N9R54_04345 [Pelobium sp.]|nr:hypothetical protein [Pelobium sp.]MDA9555444.1 hypothetical protein [Pelobium sp.]